MQFDFWLEEWREKKAFVSLVMKMCSVYGKIGVSMLVWTGVVGWYLFVDDSILGFSKQGQQILE